MAAGNGRRQGRNARWSWPGLAAVAAAVVVAVSWWMMLVAAGRTLSFEPNSDAARAAAAGPRTAALEWALLEIIAVVVLAWLERRGWLVLLAAPGLAVAGVAVLDPQSNGGALTLGLVVSLVAAVATAALMSRAPATRRQRGPAGVNNM